MDWNLHTGSTAPASAGDSRRRPGVRRLGVLVAAVALGACGIETEPGPGTRDSSVADDAGGTAGRDAAGTSGSGDAGEGPDGSSGAGDGGDGGGGAGAGGDAGPGCDEARSPRDEPCLVQDDRALFVATGGDDAAEGSMAAPLATLTAAVAKAARTDVARVIVCGGTYEETLAIRAAVSVHGGFACDETPWRHTEAPTLVQPDQAGFALRIEEVSGSVLIEDMQFTARDATSAGLSSLAAVVRESADVVLRRVQVEAGAGGAGAAGVTEAFAFPDTGAVGDECADVMVSCLEGYTAISDGGGAPREYECPGGDTTRGGAGGDYVDDELPPLPENGRSGLPALGLGLGGDGATSPEQCQSGQGGEVGAPGEAGAGGGMASIVDGQWRPAAGVEGTPGSVGQGGGGGGALAPVGGGGGGGAGGCGGAGGAAGQGGGGSIALLSVSSGLRLEQCTMRTAAGGAGGRGAEGQDGMPSGGVPGTGTSGACPGGIGGAGGKGGAGGGGAGGISAAIVWTGTEPRLESAEFELGTPGNGGAGGDDDTTEDDGVAGVAVEVAAF
jgi:hypothetical protein